MERTSGNHVAVLSSDLCVTMKKRLFLSAKAKRYDDPEWEIIGLYLKFVYFKENVQIM